MVGVALAASTRPHGRVEPLTTPESQWNKTIADWPIPGRFAFFVFKVDITYPCEDFFPGLQLHLNGESGYYVGGTLDQWDSACYASLRSDKPHDCWVIYRRVHTILSNFGYSLRGTKTSTNNRFYLI